MDKLLEYLDAKRGRRRALSAALGVQASAISMWRQVPAERVVEVEKATGIPRHKLRPDLHLAPARAPRVRVEAVL